MRNRSFSLFLLLLLFPAALRAGVDVTAATGVDFGRYKTYSFKRGIPALNARVQEQIRLSLRAALDGAGLKETTSDPDVWVVSYAFSESGAFAGIGKDEAGWGRAEHAEGTQGTLGRPRGVVQGTLRVEMHDASTNKPVWRGEASKAVGEKVHKTLKKVDRVISRMFRDYPAP